MTISTEVRKAGPFIGNDSASVFPFAFKVFKAADLIVVQRQDNIGTETTLVLDSDYHVTLNGNQDTTPGGVVTLAAGALASGFTLVVSSELPYLQTTDLTNQGGFYPKVITNALDRLTIFCQQLAEITGRTLKLPITAPTNISAEIPLPNPSELIAWNETGTGLTTISPQSLVTSIAYGSATADLFAGDGITTTFPLSTNPASVNNLDVSVGGFSQRPVQEGIGDYSWNGGASITFASPPPAPTVPGDKNILVRYMQAIPVSDSEALHAQTREALRRSYAEAGYNLVDGSFETGGVLSSALDVLLLETAGTAYYWGGVYPPGGYVVAPGIAPTAVVGFGLVAEATLRDQLASDTGYTLVPSVEIQRWRDQGDIRGWGGNIQAAIDANRVMRKPTVIPSGTTISSPLTIYDYTHIIGKGVDLSILKLADASNSPLFLSDGANSLWGTQSLGGVKGVIIEGLTIDANKANNPNGSGIAIYGYNTRISNVKIINNGKNGLRTEWADSSNASGGMEGTFENIIIDKSGEDGWRFAGPHDSTCNNVIIISSGQKAASTYKGLWIERGNARWSGLHIWTSATDLRSKYALRIDRAAEGNEFSLSHFEGADTNVDIHANNTTIDETCKVYYPWNENNIMLHGSNARIKCYIGEEYKGIGLPPAIGITLAGTYGGVSGSSIDIVGNGLEAGAIYFGLSAGYNTIKARGYSPSVSTISVGGTPAQTDMVDVVISGGNLSIYKKDISMTRAPVSAIAGFGSSQSDATQIGSSFASVLINGGSSGSGIKLPNTTSLGNGAIVTVFNSTAVTINVYPTLYQDVLGYGVNNPLQLAALKSAQFIVVDADAGKWAPFKGA